MKLLFINNEGGGGFADHIDIDEGTTIGQFFEDRMTGCESKDYLIRVNRHPVPTEYVLKEGDRITITPTKIDGNRT